MINAQWYVLLPANLKDTAYSTGKELAWPKQEALQVINLLTANSYAVFVVEPWLPTKPGPTPLVRNWPEVNSARNNLPPLTAEEFVQNFELIPSERNLNGLTPVFNIWAKRENG